MYIKEAIHEQIINVDQNKLLEVCQSEDFINSEIFSAFKWTGDMFGYDIKRTEPNILFLIWLYRAIYTSFERREDWEQQLNNWTIEEKVEFIKNSIIKSRII